MPALPNTPSGVVQLTHDVAGINFRTELSYVGAAPNTAGLTTIAGDARASYNTNLKSMCSSGYSLILTTARDLQNRATPPGIDATVVAGTRAGTAQPLNVTALINFGVNRSYRGSKPKVWLPFGTDTDIASNIAWAGAFITAMNAAWNAYIATLNGTIIGGTTLGGQVCVSYFGPPTVAATKGAKRLVSTQRALPLVQTVTSVSTRSIFGSQRRRL